MLNLRYMVRGGAPVRVVEPATERIRLSEYARIAGSSATSARRRRYSVCGPQLGPLAVFQRTFGTDDVIRAFHDSGIRQDQCDSAPDVRALKGLASDSAHTVNGDSGTGPITAIVARRPVPQRVSDELSSAGRTVPNIGLSP
jgi:hypothetical protein